MKVVILFRMTGRLPIFLIDGKIANILNNCFARLGLYKSKDVSPNHSSLTFEGPEFSFRLVTGKELYNVIDNVPKRKSSGPGYIPAWALKDSKLSIGTRLQFVANEFINKNTFPNILKTALVTPVYKKGDRLEPENPHQSHRLHIDPYQSH